MKALRIAIAALGFIAALYLPPYVPLICVVLLSLRFRSWESIVLGMWIDLLWLPSGDFHYIPLCTVLSIVIVWALEPLRLELLK